jgi:hypothetical protein
MVFDIEEKYFDIEGMYSISKKKPSISRPIFKICMSLPPNIGPDIEVFDIEENTFDIDVFTPPCHPISKVIIRYR